MVRMGLIVWFMVLITSCSNNKPDKDIKEVNALSEADYIKKGDSLVKLTFDSLRNTLLRTISESGPEEAVKFCNLNALNLTSSFASTDVTISRVTDRPRNPENILSLLDDGQYAEYKKLKQQGDSLKASIVHEEKQVHYYKPILIQAMCLTCHGSTGQELSPRLAAVIDSLYPTDNAKGYKEGELRGMWHVVFGKKSNE